MSASPIPFRKLQSDLAAFLCVPFSGLLLGASCLPSACCGASSSLQMLCAHWWHLASQCWIILLARSR